MTKKTNTKINRPKALSAGDNKSLASRSVKPKIIKAPKVKIKINPDQSKIDLKNLHSYHK